MFYQRFPEIFRIMVGVLLLTVTQSLAAASPSQTQLDEFMRVSRIQDMLPPAMQAMEAQTRQIMDGLSQQIGLTGADKKRFDQAVTQSLLPQIRREMSWQQMEPLFRQAFVQVLDAEDIQVALAFHHSAAGRAYQAASIELLRDPNFINNINNPVQMRRIYEQKLSAADFHALIQYNNSAAGQRIEAKAKQVMPQIMKSIEPQIEQVVQTFLEKELADYL